MTDQQINELTTIVSALLQREAVQYMAKGTAYEKKVKEGVKNILYFI